MVDAAGLTLVTLAVGWTLLSAGANAGSRPVPTVLTLLLLPLAVAGGRGARHHLAGAVTAVGALLGLAGLLLGLGLTLQPFDPASAPLRYGNANGSLFGLLALAVAAVLVAMPAAQRTARRGASVLLVAALVLCGLTGSIAALAATVVGLALAGGALALRCPWSAIPGATVVVLVMLGATAALAVGAGPDEPAPDSLGVRVSLWREAAALGQEEPVTGVGPGRFESEQAFTDDRDLRRAHSAPLQQLAEQGAPGLVLLLGLGGWALAALWAVRDDPVAAVGAGAVTAVALEATFDWVLSEPAVTLGLAVLVGAATARRPRRGSPG